MTGSVVGLSLFSGGGIAETYFEEIGIHIAVANELLPARARFYQYTHPHTEMICGDICEETIFNTVMKKAKAANATFLLATPPCQGMSTLGKKKYISDERNSLVHYVLKAIDEMNPDYVLIENVPKFVELLYNLDGTTFTGTERAAKPYCIVELLKQLYEPEYCIEMRVLNAMHYGVPQSRPRAIIKMYKKSLSWPWPQEEKHIISLREAIGNLPSIESGEHTDIKWHNAMVHNERQIEALRHTPEGKSAMKNEVFYPKKRDGSRVRGFHNTYNRMRWDEPAPARTTNNHLMSGHNNVHPGRTLPDGTQSDARVLTLRELIIVSSLPLNWNLPEDFKESEVRELIGEAVPPLLTKKIAKQIFAWEGEGMSYSRDSARDKWTIMMYMRDFDLMTTYAYALRASNQLSKSNIDEILDQMERDGIYRPRNGGSTFTGQFKSIQIAWYMFGYYNKARKKGEEKRMVFSPLGNLLLDNLRDREKVSKIFMTMLYGNGFRQPFSQMDERFNIFAFRLIFQLLRDPRLEGRLYSDEVFYYAMFLKTVDENTYEQLVRDIVALRKRDPYEKYEEFKRNERVIGLACHEWRYATGMLQSAGIVSVHNDHDNRIIGELTYGKINPATRRPNAIRKYREDYIRLVPELVPLADRLLEKYPYFEKPYPEDQLGRRFSSSLVVEMYSFYPPELLDELGMHTPEDKALELMLQIASDINYYSREEIATGEKFECALAEAFNMFLDVDAERIGGAGNTDIECIYYESESEQKKFDIEAKSTKRKLPQINARRLRVHRMKIGSKYTMIVAPNYATGVLKDIEGEASAIIKSATLANFFYQYVLHCGRNISYRDLNRIVEANMGKDITDEVNAYVYSNFGHAAPDFKL